MPSQESPAGRDQDGRGGSDRLRLLVAVLVGVEGLALIAGAVALLVEGLGAPRPQNSIGLAVIAAAVGLALVGCVKGLRQGARWTRGPVVTWQLLQAGVGMPVTASAYWYFGAPILAVAVIVGFLVAGRHVITREEDGLA